MPRIALTLRCALAGAALLLGSAAGAQTPSRVYALDTGLNDANGGPALTAFGTVSAASESGAQGYRFARGSGFTLSNALANVLTNPGNYTIEMRLLLDETGGYRKLVDFKDRTSDAGLYDISGGITFYPVAGDATSAFVPGQFSTVFLTRDDATDAVSAFVNGTQRFSFIDGTGLGVFTGAGNIMRFFHDDLAQNSEHSAGFVDYIRLYDEALSAQQIGAAPPLNSTVPEPTTVGLLGFGLAAVGGVAARRRRA